MEILIIAMVFAVPELCAFSQNRLHGTYSVSLSNRFFFTDGFYRAQRVLIVCVCDCLAHHK